MCPLFTPLHHCACLQLETYGEMKGAAAASHFASNLGAFVDRADFCTFRNASGSASGSASDDDDAARSKAWAAATAAQRASHVPSLPHVAAAAVLDRAGVGLLAPRSRSVLVASDSLLLKTKLRERWEPRGWRLHYFATTGDRLTDVARPAGGFAQGHLSPLASGLSRRGPTLPTGLSGDLFGGPADNEGPTGEGHGGTVSQFLTLVELWLLSRSRPLLAMAFFDLRLATIDALPPLPGLTSGLTPGLDGGERAVAAGNVAHEFVLSAKQPNKPRKSSALLHAGPLHAGAAGLQLAEGGLRALSTFSKAAALLGGLDALESFGQCASTGMGATALPVAKPGPGPCSSECGGRPTVFSP